MKFGFTFLFLLLSFCTRANSSDSLKLMIKQVEELGAFDCELMGGLDPQESASYRIAHKIITEASDSFLLAHCTDSFRIMRLYILEHFIQSEIGQDTLLAQLKTMRNDTLEVVRNCGCFMTSVKPVYFLSSSIQNGYANLIPELKQLCQAIQEERMKREGTWIERNRP